MQLFRDPRFLPAGLSPSSFRKKGIYLLFGVFMGSILLSAVLSPLFFKGVQWMMQHYPEWVPGFLARRTEAEDFPKYFDRIRWIPVLVLMPWILSHAGIRWKTIFSTPSPARFFEWALAGLALWLPVMLVQGASGSVRSAGEAVELLGVLGGAAVTGLAVGVIEETVFRGILFRLFYTAFRPLTAVLLSALFFAWVHFKKVEIGPDVTIGFEHGFEVAFRTLVAFTQNFELIRFVNLFAAGLVLNLLLLRTGSLWACMGLHAGWVSLRAAWGKLVDNVGQPSLLYGGEGLTDGLLPLVFLTVMIYLNRKAFLRTAMNSV